jgi:hypothetical protein
MLTQNILSNSHVYLRLDSILFYFIPKILTLFGFTIFLLWAFLMSIIPLFQNHVVCTKFVICVFIMVAIILSRSNSNMFQIHKEILRHTNLPCLLCLLLSTLYVLSKYTYIATNTCIKHTPFDRNLLDTNVGW